MKNKQIEAYVKVRKREGPQRFTLKTTLENEATREEEDLIRFVSFFRGRSAQNRGIFVTLDLRRDQDVAPCLSRTERNECSLFFSSFTSIPNTR